MGGRYEAVLSRDITRWWACWVEYSASGAGHDGAAAADRGTTVPLGNGYAGSGDQAELAGPGDGLGADH